jgi:hypothetical protein
MTPKFLSNTNMTPLVINPYKYPASYIRGLKCIEFIFGSTNLLQHVKISGYTPFLETPCEDSDHRGVFIDLDQIALLGATNHSISPQIKKYISNYSPEIHTPSQKQQKHR